MDEVHPVRWARGRGPGCGWVMGGWGRGGGAAWERTGPPRLTEFLSHFPPRASISRDPFYDMLATRKRRIANKK